MKTAKMYAALAGSIVTALLAELGPDGTVGTVLTLASVVLTAFATYRIPNAE